MKANGLTHTSSTLDQAISPIKHTKFYGHGHDSNLEREDSYDRQYPYRPHDHDYDRNGNVSSITIDGKHHSRIHIANLLCEDGRNADASIKHHRQDRISQQQQHYSQQTQLRAITEEADDYRERHLSFKNSSSNNGSGTNGSRSNGYPNSGYSSPSPSGEYSPQNRNNREPAFAQRAIDTAPSSYRASHADQYHHNGSTRPASFSAATSVSSAPYASASSSSNASYTAVPRPAHLGSQQRSASWNTDRYQDYDSNHSYEQDHQPRMDRSKSDYALHQQNYGPYLDSPPLSNAVLHKSHPSDGPSMVSTSAAAAIETSAPLYYHAPPSSSTSLAVSYSSYSGATPTNARSSAPSGTTSGRNVHEYGHAQTAEASPGDQLRRQSRGPMLPPPSALLSAAESKPPRVYGRDSTVDDNWTPMPRSNRVVPVDAPNETRPYTFTSSGLLPPPYPSSSSISKSSSSSSSSHLSYPSSYSSAPVEPKPRRIYGIDAADIPQRLPPPAPSASYGSSQYSKPLHHIPDDPEGEARRRSVGQDSSSYSRNYGSSSSMAAAYGAQAYGYSAPSSHHHPSSSSDMDRPRYDYDNRGWKSAQSQPNRPATSSTSASSYAPSRPYSRPQSPTYDIKPPTWYQNYAHSVPPKPQAQLPYQHSDYYSDHAHHEQSGVYSSGGYHSSDPSAGHDYEHGDERSSGHRSSKRSKSSMSASQSVHPFDTAEQKSKSKKPKRIKNPGHDEDIIVMDDEFYAVKAKRKRANASQLSVLNAAFERSYFPSTEERLRLSKQCRMCPRTVQIWFQNKRQSVKARSEAMEAAVAASGSEGRRDSGEDDSSDGQKRSIDDEKGESKRRTSGPGGMTPSEAVMSALHIQRDGRSVDYFSKKRRATAAKLEKQQQEQQQQEQQEQEQHSDKE
ncbi:hypothetical protein BGZ54_003472 [Gamsiella multidivaricata]|nr:hypothetical protein BGZ54_003472 [Gamsiella multidivaricata]